MHDQALKAGWLTLKAASTYSGLSLRLIQDYVKDGLVVASHVTRPGARRGRTLIELASLEKFIREGIGGKADITLNTRKGERHQSLPHIEEAGEDLKNRRGGGRR